MLPQPPPGFGSLSLPELFIILAIVLLIWQAYRSRSGGGGPF